MNPVLLTTEEFWQQMCRPAFRRTSQHSGAVGNTVYVCVLAPEDLPGFMDEKIAQIRCVLGCQP